jgi:hypothetical protein
MSWKMQNSVTLDVLAISQSFELASNSATSARAGILIIFFVIRNVSSIVKMQQGMRQSEAGEYKGRRKIRCFNMMYELG